MVVLPNPFTHDPCQWQGVRHVRYVEHRDADVMVSTDHGAMFLGEHQGLLIGSRHRRFRIDAEAASWILKVDTEDVWRCHKV